MEELYTFNSKQLQAFKYTQQQQTLANYRKKILSCSHSPKARTTQASKLILKQNQQTSFKSKPFKKIRLGLPIERAIDNKLMTKTNRQTKFQDTRSFDLHKSADNSQTITEAEKNERGGSSHIKPIRATIKRAFSAVQRGQYQQKNKPLIEIEQIQNENVQRKQKKSTSMKLSPKIRFPISNRKLPSAFKAKFDQKYLQKIATSQKKQHIPKIPLACQNQPYFAENREALWQEIEKFKKRLIVESRLLQKLSMPA